MNNFNVSSPPTNDPISKLQNLLNNSLSSLIDVFNNLSYIGESKELNIETFKTSEYNEFVEKLKQFEAENDTQISNETEKKDVNKNKKITNDNINRHVVESKIGNDVFVKPHFDDSAKTEILNRVERLYFILEKMNESIDELPDCSVSEEERCKEMKFLQQVKNEKMLELKELYNKYDSLYNMIRLSLRKETMYKN